MFACLRVCVFDAFVCVLVCVVLCLCVRLFVCCVFGVRLCDCVLGCLCSLRVGVLVCLRVCARF